MRSTNPILSRPGAFTSASQYPSDPYAPNAWQNAPALMTVDDVITKTSITMGVLVAAAAAAFFLLPLSLLYPAMLVSGLVGFVTVLFVSFRRTVSPSLVLAYSVLEGVFIGGLSKLFEYSSPGIVTPAVLGTFVAGGVTLASYKYFRIRITNRFRQIVTIGTLSFAGVMLLNLAFAAFGVNLGVRSVSGGVGGLAILMSVVGIGLAVMNLMMDFDYVEQGVAMRAPADESWRAAFGLTVTMVWLYTELLRLLDYVRRS